MSNQHGNNWENDIDPGEIVRLEQARHWVRQSNQNLRHGAICENNDGSGYVLHFQGEKKYMSVHIPHGTKMIEQFVFDGVGWLFTKATKDDAVRYDINQLEPDNAAREMMETLRFLELLSDDESEEFFDE